ncbi:hypothetical protein BCR41DRAFT_373293 [Lobosporangium transversale]|uniref:Uncharacterized protein n=1 Tax=Lobosporangium transversale TaxID=64571 RepID=A0A1Y2GI82_9FUNG|nr:hypothetical protein BCR41DRAFT_373293 [Lobosporangium transversale]ORZ08257.1 hypothetical protein BCR41DRAFT_373293 [Lobosporangium transversale]|eukprot:XP_021878340.1 hypothetical protein BCR41DRAFT_373293 [Lobosporangium transversale]
MAWSVTKSQIKTSSMRFKQNTELISKASKYQNEILGGELSLDASTSVYGRKVDLQLRITDDIELNNSEFKRKNLLINHSMMLNLEEKVGWSWEDNRLLAMDVNGTFSGSQTCFYVMSITHHLIIQFEIGWTATPLENYFDSHLSNVNLWPVKELKTNSHMETILDSDILKSGFLKALQTIWSLWFLRTRMYVYAVLRHSESIAGMDPMNSY